MSIQHADPDVPQREQRVVAPVGGQSDGEQPYTEAYFTSTYPVDGLKRYSSHWWAVRLYAGLVHQQMRRMGARRFLEVGCGQGFLLAMLEDRYDCFGVDLSPFAVKQCARVAPRSQCVVGNLEQALPPELPEGSFDVVVAKYVFEHLHDPQTAMERVKRLVRPGGVLIFSVPYTDSIGAHWKGADWYARKDPTHCSLLSREKWLEIIRGVGLQVRRETADGYWDVPYLSWMPGILQKVIFLGPSALACMIARPILPARFGENIIVIAERPTT